jgi:predicted phosphodiesterase
MSNTTSSLTTGNISDFDFVAVGDFEHSADTKKVCANMKAQNPKFLLNLGDFSYESSPDWAKKWWDEYMKDIHHIEHWAVMGNHDRNFAGSYLSIFKHYNPNFASWIYWFKKESIFFLMLNTETNHNRDSDQYKYAEERLARTMPDYSGNGEDKVDGVTFRVVCFHKPIYCSLVTHSPYASFRHFHELFDKYKVDLVLSGHNHNYERSYPLSFTGKEKPKVNDTRRHDYIDTNGSVFANIGSGGRHLYDMDNCEPYIYEQYCGYGHLMIGLRENGTKLSCKFYDTEMNERDHYSIKKTIMAG